MEDLKRVIIKGIDIPFIDLVVLLIKLAFASIPAMFGGLFDIFYV